MNLLDINFYQLLPTTSIGNELGHQKRIQMLILGFKESRRQKEALLAGNCETTLTTYRGQEL